MSNPTRRSSKKRTVNAREKEDVVKKKLTEFYSSEISRNTVLSSHINTDNATFLGAGAFGHVFHVTAKKDVNFSDLEAITVALTADEKHSFINRVEPLKQLHNNEVAIRRGTSLALKCETAFVFQVENFPVQAKCLPNADVERCSLYKEYNTLRSVFERYGYKKARGFTKPYAYGRLGDYPFIHYDEITRTKLQGFHFLMLEFCGPDLEDMMDICSHNCRQNDQRLSTRTVFMIGDQFISRLQCLQEPSVGLSHNDLKCDQLMTGRGENTNVIYLIDYGLAGSFKDTWHSSTQIVPVGNRRWAPRSNHQMAARTPLCEIESACYVLLRLLKNHFPWDGMFDQQLLRLQELKDRGEHDTTIKSGDQLLYEEKQFLWMYLRKRSGHSALQMTEEVELEIEKYSDFFEERNDRWGDGGSQMLELMAHMAKLGDPVYCSFVEKMLDYSDINYMAIRSHLLSIFDLSMYANSIESSVLMGPVKLQTELFFRENRERCQQRTECGRPVYYYFPEAERHCFWEWHCRCRDLWEDKPEYWHKVLANREELAEQLRLRQMSGKRQQVFADTNSTNTPSLIS